MLKEKLLYTTNIPSPYRVEFFNELGKYVDLTVAYERKSAKTRNDDWLGNKATNFKAVFMKGIAIGDDTAFCPEIVKMILNGSYDRIIIGAYYTATGILATELLRILKKPFSFSGDGGFVHHENLIKRMIKNHLQSGGEMYFSPSNCGDQVLYNAGYRKDQIKRYAFTSIKEKDILSEPVSEAERTELRRVLGVSETKMVLGVGRLLYCKGWDTLLDMAERFGPEVGIYLVGGDPRGSCYESYLEKGLPNIHFVDFKQKAELAKYYKAADVFVLPTHGDVWGLVVNEAMAYGLPVITTKTCVAGLELVRDGKNGYLFEANKRDELFIRINNILSNTELRISMSAHALATIRSYTIEKMVNDYLKALNIDDGHHMEE